MFKKEEMRKHVYTVEAILNIFKCTVNWANEWYVNCVGGQGFTMKEIRNISGMREDKKEAYLKIHVCVNEYIYTYILTY